MAPFASSRWPMVLSVEFFKDINGTLRPKKLGDQRRDSSRISGTSFVGKVLSG